MRKKNLILLAFVAMLPWTVLAAGVVYLDPEGFTSEKEAYSDYWELVSHKSSGRCFRLSKNGAMMLNTLIADAKDRNKTEKLKPEDGYRIRIVLAKKEFTSPDVRSYFRVAQRPKQLKKSELSLKSSSVIKLKIYEFKLISNFILSDHLIIKGESREISGQVLSHLKDVRAVAKSREGSFVLIDLKKLKETKKSRLKLVAKVYAPPKEGVESQIEGMPDPSAPLADSSEFETDQ